MNIKNMPKNDFLVNSIHIGLNSKINNNTS